MEPTVDIPEMPNGGPVRLLVMEIWEGVASQIFVARDDYIVPNTGTALYWILPPWGRNSAVDAVLPTLIQYSRRPRLSYVERFWLTEYVYSTLMYSANEYANKEMSN